MKRIILTVLFCITTILTAMPLCVTATDSYTVTYDLTNMTANGPAELAVGDDLYVTLVADDGYMMPKDVAVSAVGSAGVQYDIDATMTTGNLLLLASDISGNITITAEAVKKYDIHFVGESWTATAPVPAGQSLNSYYDCPNVSLDKEGYVFEGWFESTDGGVTLADTPFNFDTPMQSDVTVYPKWTLSPYSVTYDLTNMTANGPAELTVGDDLYITLAAEEGYMMPDTVAVTVNGVLLDNILYDIDATMATGNLLLLASDISGNITITAESVKKYDIHFVGESWTATAPVPAGQSLNSYYDSPDVSLDKEGYVFEGWFESTDSGVTFADTPFDFDTPIQRDVTVYPKWVAQTADTDPTTTTTTTTTTSAATTTTTTSAATTTTTTTTTATAATTTATTALPTVSPQTGHSDMLAAAGTLLVFALGGALLALRRLVRPTTER